MILIGLNLLVDCLLVWNWWCEMVFMDGYDGLIIFIVVFDFFVLIYDV